MKRTVFAALVIPAVVTLAALATAGVRQSYARPGLAAGGEQPGGGCRMEDLGTVSAQASSSAPVPAGWRRAGGGPVTRTGSLGRDCVSPNWNGELARYYRFELTRAAEVEVTITSSEIGTWVGLREGAALGGSLMAQASAWAGEVARVTTRLGAGAYTVEASSPKEGVATAGPFTLTVETRNADEAARVAGVQGSGSRQGGTTSARTDGRSATGSSRQRVAASPSSSVPAGVTGGRQATRIGPSMEETKNWLTQNTGTNLYYRYELEYVSTSTMEASALSREISLSRLPELLRGEAVSSCEMWYNSYRAVTSNTTGAGENFLDRSVYAHAVKLEFSEVSRLMARDKLRVGRDNVIDFDSRGGRISVYFRSPMSSFQVLDSTERYLYRERPPHNEDSRGQLERSEVREVHLEFSSAVSSEQVQNAIVHLASLCGNDSVTVGDLF